MGWLASLRRPTASTLCVKRGLTLIDKDFPLIGNYAVQSDVSGERDGIGIEVLEGDDFLLEIFRDDTKKKREVTLHKKDVPLELVEQSIQLFKREIPWDFIEYDEQNT